MYHVEVLIILDEQQMHHVPQEFFVLRKTYVLNSCTCYTQRPWGKTRIQFVLISTWICTKAYTCKGLACLTLTVSAEKGFLP